MHTFTKSLSWRKYTLLAPSSTPAAGAPPFPSQGSSCSSGLKKVASNLGQLGPAVFASPYRLSHSSLLSLCHILCDSLIASLKLLH